MWNDGKCLIYIDVGMYLLYLLVVIRVSSTASCLPCCCTHSILDGSWVGEGLRPTALSLLASCFTAFILPFSAINHNQSLQPQSCML